MSDKTKHIATLSMLAAMAIVLMLFIRVPFMPGAPFLIYDPKDVVILIGGLMFGPLAAFILSIVVALIEMVTVSDGGPIGFLMGSLASITFTVPAALIYKRFGNLKGAIIGILVGIVAASSAMILWNYIVVPLYTGWPRADVVPMLLPVFLPFNLIKFGLNASIAILIYKPVTNALREAKLYNPNKQATKPAGKFNLWVVLLAVFVAVSLISLIISMGE